jgi:hypothetical protein
LPLLLDGVEDVEVEGFWCRGKKTAAATSLEKAYCSADRVDQPADRVGGRVCEESD